MKELPAIIALRKRKSDKEQSLLRELQQKVSNCEADLRRARQDVEDFRKKLSTMERDLLLEIIEKSVSVGAILDVERKMKDAQKEAQRLVDKVNAAKKTLDDAQDERDVQKIKLRKAQGKVARFTELGKQLTQQEKMRQTTAEDALIDEFVETSFGHKK